MPVGTVAEMSDEAFDKLIDINLKGSFNALREAARRMRDGGRVVNFSSSVTGLRQPTFAAYAATKAAIEVITPILAKELTGRNITVNAVAPGPVATELMLSHSTPEAIERLVSMTPLRRLGQPEDIASAVAFLVGPDAGWVNGQTIRVNGGII
jgi:3-oxoacyl-[acyl-carrier protein] reductase